MASSSSSHSRYSIDQMRFAECENIYYSKGSGDSLVQLNFTRLKDPYGQEYWIWEQTNETWLYHKLPADTDVGRCSVTKVFKADSLGKKAHKEKATFSWLNLTNPLQHSKHFGPRKTALKLEDREGTHYFVEIPLWKWTPTELLSASTSADGIAGSFRTKIALEKVPSISTVAPMAVGFAFFLLFGLGVFDKLGLLVLLFWILAPCALMTQAISWLSGWMKTTTSELVKFVSTLFSLHFALHCLDAAVSEHNLITGLGYYQAESFSLAITSLFLAAAYRFPRAYMAIAEGAWFCGGSCWGLAFIVTCCRSMDDQYFYFRHFIYDTGSQPWGSGILAITAGGIIYKYFDYRRAPTTLKSFSSKLERLARGLERPGRLAKETLKLANLADDLEDAFDISREPKLLQWNSYAKDLGELRDQLLALGKVKKASLTLEETTRIDSDLALIAADLRGFGHSVAGTQDNEATPDPELAVSSPTSKKSKKSKKPVRAYEAMKKAEVYYGLRLSPSLQILKYTSPHRQFPFA